MTVVITQNQPDAVAYQDNGTPVPVLVTGAPGVPGIPGTPGDPGDPGEPGAPGGIGLVATRAALAALISTAVPQQLDEAGREGLFRFYATDLSAKVAADTEEGIYVAPDSDPDGSSGAWVRQFGGDPIDPRWFGLSEANSAAANTTAVNGMLATRQARASNITTNYQGVEPILFPAGFFNLDATIDLTNGTGIIEGVTTGRSDGHGTVLKFPAGVTGLRVQRYNTSGASTTDGVTHRAGDGTVIRNLTLRGAFAATEAEAHGIHVRAKCLIQDCYVESFEGDGIHINATQGGGSNEGNASYSRIIGGTVSSCRRGLYINGADANVIMTLGLSVISNRQWGIHDSGFLGNVFEACHSSSNGITTAAAAIAPTKVTHGGNRYFVIAGQEVGASTNAPTGTTASNQWWGFSDVGGVGTGIPAWVSGTTYRAGGSFHTDSNSADHLFSGCYTEGGQGPAQIISPAVINGGNLVEAIYAPVDAMPTIIKGDLIKALTGKSEFGEAVVGKPTSSTALLTVHQKAALSTSIRSRLNLAVGLEADGTTPAPIAQIGGRPTTADPATAQGRLIFATRTTGAVMTEQAVVDPGGLYPSTDNVLPLGLASQRWTALHAMVVTSYGAINSNSATAGVGYRAGAGAAVTQLTSKSTAPPAINRVCGQITMNNAALAAGASVSFTVSNNIVVATDTIIVNIASGATINSYHVGVTAVAAGSFRIQVTNISGGSLSEALVLNFAILRAVAS